MRWTECHTDCFLGHVSISRVKSCCDCCDSERRRSVPPSHIASINRFIAVVVAVCALSYSAISQMPPRPQPPPSPPNPIHITFQSSSSCSPSLSIFYFPSSPPVLQLFPSSQTHFQQFSLSLRLERFFFFNCLSLSDSIWSEFPLFDKVEASAVLGAA